MPTIDDINEKLRDFVGWNSANPLPTGDPETGVFHPSKKDLRDLFIAILQAQGDPDALDRIIAAASKGATTRANAVAIGQSNLPTSAGLLFNRAGPGLDTLEVRTAAGTEDPLFDTAPRWGRIQQLASLDAVQRITSLVTLTEAAGNAANAIVGTTPAVLQDGAVIAHRARFANASGDMTIRVNELPALPLYDYEGGPIMRGDIPLNSMVYARYYASANQFRLTGPVRHQRPACVVQKAAAEINIYQQASGDFYKHYQLERVPVPARNSDVWRIVRIDWVRALSRSNYSVVTNLTTPNSEIEQVIYLNGAIEGIGGSIHGNEIATAFSMSIDGGTVGTDGWYACERVTLFQTSSGYLPGSTLATEYTPRGPEIFRTNREWHFADGCLTLNNAIVNVASGYTVLRGYVGMCPLRLAQTSRVAHFPYSEIFTTGGTVDRISNSHRMIGWGPDYYGDVEVIRGWDSATAEMRMKLDSAPEGKMYPDALRGRVTVAGQTWAFSTRLRFGTAEEITAIPQNGRASLGDVSATAKIVTDLPNVVRARGSIVSGTDLSTIVAPGMYQGANSGVYGSRPSDFASGSFELLVSNAGDGTPSGSSRFVIQRLTALSVTDPNESYASRRSYSRMIDTLNPSVITGQFRWVREGKPAGKPLSGRVLVTWGDSITQGSTDGVFRMQPLIEAATGATVVNGGFGGCTMAQNPFTSGDGPARNAMSAYKLAEAVLNNDWSAVIAGAQATDSPAVRIANAQALSATNWAAVDYLAIMFGTNDFIGNVPLGLASDTTGATFRGAINRTIIDVLTARPQIKMVFFTPLWRSRVLVNGDDSNITPNSGGIFLREYCDAIKERAKAFQIPVVDLHDASGANIINWTTIMPDGLHPYSTVGMSQVASRVSAGIAGTFLP